MRARILLVQNGKSHMNEHVETQRSTELMIGVSAKLRSAPTDTATGPLVTRASILGFEKDFTKIALEEVALDCSKQLQGSRAGTCSLEVFPSLITAMMTQRHSTNPYSRCLCIAMLARSFLRSVGV